MPRCNIHGDWELDFSAFAGGGCPVCAQEEKDREETRRYRKQTLREATQAQEREIAREEEDREGEEADEEAEREREETREEAEREREEAREEAARERAEQAAREAEDRVYRVNNPGDFDCPYCMLRSLRRAAKRCPKCQHDIEPGYWTGVFARELEERNRQEEARLREQEARLRAEEERRRKQKAHEDWLKSAEGIASIAAEESERAKAHDEQRRRVRTRKVIGSALGGVAMGAVVGIILGLIVFVVVGIGGWLYEALGSYHDGVLGSHPDFHPRDIAVKWVFWLSTTAGLVVGACIGAATADA